MRQDTRRAMEMTRRGDTDKRSLETDAKLQDSIYMLVQQKSRRVRIQEHDDYPRLKVARKCPTSASDNA